MPISKDHSELRATPEVKMSEPPGEARYGHVLADTWAQTIDRSERAMSGATLLRASWAGRCARELTYRLRATPETNPMEPADYWRMGLGTMVHELLGADIEKAFPGARVEVGASIGDLISATVDIVVDNPDMATFAPEATESHPYRTSIEVKTINGWGYKMAIGARGTAEGPKTSHKLQAFIGAKAVGADECRIIYLSLENLSPSEASRHGIEGYGRFLAEWAYPREVYEPIADAELARLQLVREAHEAGTLAPRVVPDMPPGARITNPATGAWLQKNQAGEIIGTDKTWMCGYCSFRDRCLEDG